MDFFHSPDSFICCACVTCVVFAIQASLDVTTLVK